MNKILAILACISLAGLMMVPSGAASEHEDECEDRQLREWEANLDCALTGSFDGAVDLGDSTGRLLNGFMDIGVDASCFLSGIC